MQFERLLPRFNWNGPPDDDRHWSMLVTDSITQKPTSVSGIESGSIETIPITLYDGNGNLITGGSFETSTIYNGDIALAPQFAIISAASNGNNTVISSTSGKRIRVLAGALVASGSVNVYFNDGAASPITGTMNFVSNSGVQIPYAPTGNFQTSVGNALVLNLSGATNVGGWLTYLLV